MRIIQSALVWKCELLFLSVLAPLLLAGVSRAELLGSGVPTITLSASSVEQPWRWTPNENQLQDSPDGRELRNEFTVVNALPEVANLTVKELEFDPDPFVLNNILVTNTSATTQIFSAFVGLPTAFPAPNTISGGLTVSVIDGGNDGATLATSAPSPIYQAQIDGTGVADLFPHPFSLVAPAGSLNLTSTSFGPSLNLVPVTSSIGIQLRFTLTPGDSASILSRFDVIPEPATVTLGGIAMLVGLALARRPS